MKKIYCRTAKEKYEAFLAGKVLVDDYGYKMYMDKEDDWLFIHESSSGGKYPLKSNWDSTNFYYTEEPKMVPITDRGRLLEKIVELNKKYDGRLVVRYGTYPFGFVGYSSYDWVVELYKWAVLQDGKFVNPDTGEETEGLEFMEEER